MRHFLCPGSAAAHPGGVLAPPAQARLVAPACRPLAVPPGLSSAGAGAIALASVTVAADHHLAPAASAEEQPRRARFGPAVAAKPSSAEYCCRMRAQHGVGHGVGQVRQIRAGAVLAPILASTPAAVATYRADRKRQAQPGKLQDALRRRGDLNQPPAAPAVSPQDAPELRGFRPPSTPEDIEAGEELTIDYQRPFGSLVSRLAPVKAVA
jgi:hypothetical protein